MNDSILLDVGTGELEIIIFNVGKSSYCINVLKAREIIVMDKVTPLACSDKSILGLTNVRGNIMTVIDLNYILYGTQSDLSKSNMALVCEFNQRQIMFVVDSIEGIRRIKWSDIGKPDALNCTPLAVGNILLDDNILLMLDFEKIISDLASDDSLEKIKNEVTLKEERKTKRIYLADDSKVIREFLKDTLSKSGYTDIHEYDNGKEALDAIMALKKTYGESYRDSIDLLITDIEMPILDGHTLTRQLKEDSVLHKLPIVIYSSLITEDLYHKGLKVGADKQISKPSIGELVTAIDSLLFK